jgi:hypothetical protein
MDSMKKNLYLFLTISIILSCSFILKEDHHAKDPIDENCQCKGKQMYGKVQFVKSFPDIKVQIVTAFPDLKVKMVTAFPDKCGMWQEVTAFPDVKVQLVDAFPDVKIQYVDNFPGKPWTD